MSVLSDKTLRKRLNADPEIGIVVDPLAYGAIQPSSIDLRLGPTLLTCDAPDAPVDLGRSMPPAFTHREIEGAWFLFPDQFVLGATLEWIEVPDDLVGVLVGKSSLARLGLQVEAAGYVDPGWKGNLTVEIKNLGRMTLVLRPGMPIAQIRFETLTEPCEQPYGSAQLRSHYQGSAGPVESRLSLAVTP